MTSTESPAWQSSFRPEAEDAHAAQERGRAGGTLIIAAAIITAVLKCLMAPDAPFPVTTVLICAIVAFGGFVICVFCTQWMQRGTFLRALCAPKSLLSFVLLLAVLGGAVFHYLLNARLTFNRDAKSFTCIEDHIDYLLSQDDPRIAALARQALAAKYKPAEIENGYVSADLRAIEKANYHGKGFFLAVARTTDTPDHASLILKNDSDSTMTVTIDGPVSHQLTLEPHASESCQLPPGDYETAASIQGDYTVSPLAATKHVVAGTAYKGILNLTDNGSLAKGDLAHK